MPSVGLEDSLHLLGVTRTGLWRDFACLGVASFDSTTPLRQSFKDDTDNYYTLDRTYPAIRVPQVDGTEHLQRSIQAGIVSQEEATPKERACLAAMRSYAAGRASPEQVADLLGRYDELFQRCGTRKWRSADTYREVLAARPWQAPARPAARLVTMCSCSVAPSESALGRRCLGQLWRDSTTSAGLSRCWGRGLSAVASQRCGQALEFTPRFALFRR